MVVLQVMSRVPLTLAPSGGPVHMTHVRGYLFLAAPTGVAVFNTTGFSNRRAPRMILAHAYSNVASAFAPEDMVGRFACNMLHVQMTLQGHSQADASVVMEALLAAPESARCREEWYVCPAGWHAGSRHIFSFLLPVLQDFV